MEHTKYCWYIKNSLHLARKDARIFVRGHYLLKEANSSPRVQLEENLSFEEQVMSRDKTSDHIFASTGGYCVNYSSNLLRNKRSFENWGIFSDFPGNGEIYGHVTPLGQSHASENIWWIILRDILCVESCYTSQSRAQAEVNLKSTTSQPTSQASRVSISGGWGLYFRDFNRQIWKSEYTNTEIKQQHDIMKYWEVRRLGKNPSPR